MINSFDSAKKKSMNENITTKYIACVEYRIYGDEREMVKQILWVYRELMVIEILSSLSAANTKKLV